VRISEMCKQVKLKLGTMLGTWGTANNAVCMGSASQGAPLHNGRIPWRVTHALPKACALYCFVSSTFTARNAVELRLYGSTWHARHLADHAVLHFDKSTRRGVAV
jgi:hypothetical protein